MSALTSSHDETLIQDEGHTETLLAERLLEFANEAFVFSNTTRRQDKPEQGPKRFPAPSRSYFADVTPPPLARHHLKNTRVVPGREHILPFLPRHGHYAEIGAVTGDFVWHILSVLEPARLHLCNQDFNSFDSAAFGGAMEKGIIEIHETGPEAFFAGQPDGHFDLICLNPGHSHAATAHALEQAARKINDTGCILCANYTTYAPLEGVKYGVARAVHEFCHTAGFELAFLALNAFGHQDVVLRRLAPADQPLAGTDGSFDVPDAGSYQPDIWEYLVAKYNIQTVLDLGAGAGWSTKWFVDRGIYALGVEQRKEAIAHSKCRGNIIEHDYSDGPFIPSMVLDLAWCAGFGQTLDEQLIPNFMASLQNCRFVCLANAGSDGPGTEATAGRSNTFWIDKMNQFGFDHDAAETARLRSAGNAAGAHARRSISFFKRRSEEPSR